MPGARTSSRWWPWPRPSSPAVVQIQTKSGLGSGIIYDATGLIVTNAHVVGTASQDVQVTLADGQTL